MEKVILQIFRQERVFSKQELEAIVEEKLLSERSKKQNIRPIEGKWFKVDLTTINPHIFKETRRDLRQEQTRQIICEAIAEVYYHPERYPKSFEIMIPSRTWESKSVAELKELATNLGDRMANWIEQAILWAQIIHNGETWEELCNMPDTANSYRLVKWRGGFPRLIGDFGNGINKSPATDVGGYNYPLTSTLQKTVPLVVRYK